MSRLYERVRQALWVLFATASVVVLVGLLAAIAFGAPRPDSAACEYPPASVLDNVIRLTAQADYDEHGAGFYGADGLIYTAGHVIIFSDRAIIAWLGNRPFVVRPLQAAMTHRKPPSYGRTDWGLAVTPGVTLPGIEIQYDDPRQGQRVWVVGYPMYARRYVTEGRYMGTDIYGTHMVTAMVAPGNSGGPVLTCEEGRWRAVAIISGVASTRGGPFSPPHPIYHIAAIELISEFGRLPAPYMM